MSNILHYSKLALLDLEEIQEYILAESCSLDIAENIVEKILSTAELLTDFSEIGSRLDSFVPFHSDYRVLTAQKYLIFYRVSDNKIYIDRILHSRRNYIRILFGEI